jgi:hypothetical protein
VSAGSSGSGVRLRHGGHGGWNISPPTANCLGQRLVALHAICSLKSIFGYKMYIRACCIGKHTYFRLIFSGESCRSRQGPGTGAGGRHRYPGYQVLSQNGWYARMHIGAILLTKAEAECPPPAKNVSTFRFDTA